MIERSLIIIKPDGVKRQLTGEILRRFERVGIKIIGMKMVHIDKVFAEKHYKAHEGKHFFGILTDYLISSPVVVAVLEGVNAISNVRKIVGTTYPHEAPPGTVRGDFCHISRVYADEKNIAVPNVIHASGSVKEAKEEIELWFEKKDVHDYKVVNEEFMFS